jgi:F1F0 ATPase subunit 2
MLGIGLQTSSEKFAKTTRTMIEMNSTEFIAISLSLLAGVLIGTLFFAGLWWTVRYGLRSNHPALLFMISLIARLGLAFGAFYLVSDGALDRLAAALLGFLMSRHFIQWWVRPRTEPKIRKVINAFKS